MSKRADAIIAMLEVCGEDDTLEVARTALNLISMDQIIELVLTTLDDDGKEELAERLRGEAS